jgi:hypothetical protein
MVVRSFVNTAQVSVSLKKAIKLFERKLLLLQTVKHQISDDNNNSSSNSYSYNNDSWLSQLQAPVL